MITQHLSEEHDLHLRRRVHVEIVDVQPFFETDSHTSIRSPLAVPPLWYSLQVYRKPDAHLSAGCDVRGLTQKG
ncbi:hypothetical protein E2C01_041220 [Portunus trituberculatus]|uniref:Uncharacterized protein n=1 Tax=Portunus trituberculatus TaxID=210409 RepID=A0A5B7FM07_PORTR|nr:hypothetical protein [Portunus trituberculatus]